MKKVLFSRFALLSAAFTVATAGAALTSCTEDGPTDTPAIPVVRLDTPKNPALTTSTAEELTFSWDAVTGAFSYNAQLRLNESGAVVKEAIVAGANTNVTFGELIPGTEYWFQVRANDEFSEGRNSFFSDFAKGTTGTVDPQLTPLARPQEVICDATKTTVSSLTFRWDAVEYAASYTWQMATAGGDPVYGIDETEPVEGKVSVTVTGLAQGTAYSFQVRANPAEDSETYRSGAYSDPVTAATLSALGNPAPELDPEATTQTTLKFTWEAVEGAANYLWSISGDGGETYGDETSTVDTYAIAGGLEPGTEYMFRVKAVHVEGSTVNVESGYGFATGATISDAAVPLATPAPEEVAAETTYGGFKVTWPAVENAANYLVKINDEEPVEVAETAYTASGLAPATTYAVSVKAVAAAGQNLILDSEWSTAINITTALPPDAVTVTNVDELKAAIAGIVDGGTITLAAGEYNFVSLDDSGETPVWELNNVRIEKSMNIIGPAVADGALPTARINAGSLQLFANIENITVKNIEYTAFNPDTATGSIGTTPKSGGYFLDVQSTNLVQNVTVENCYVHNLAGAGALRANRGSVAGIKNVTMQNNLFYNINGANGCIVNARDKAAIENSVWLFKNNTVTGIGVYGGAPTKQRIMGIPTGGTTCQYTITNNTFYDIFSSDNCIDATSATVDNGVIVIEKNIFVAYGENVANLKTPRIGNNPGVSVKDNLIYPDWTFASSYPISSPDATNTYGVNPAFAGVSSGAETPGSANFTPSAAVTALGVGDPRWLQGGGGDGPTALSAPAVGLDAGSIVAGTSQAVTASWAAVANAESYDVSFNGGAAVNQAALSYTIDAATVAALAAGTYTVSVVAKPAGGSTTHLASTAGSATLTITSGGGGPVTTDTTWNISDCVIPSAANGELTADTEILPGLMALAAGSDVRINSHSRNYPADELSFNKRFQTRGKPVGGAAAPTARALKFGVASACTLTVYFASGSSSARTLNIANGTAVLDSTFSSANDNEVIKAVYNYTGSAGNIYLSGSDNTSIFMIIVDYP